MWVAAMKNNLFCYWLLLYAVYCIENSQRTTKSWHPHFRGSPAWSHSAMGHHKSANVVGLVTLVGR